MNNAQNTFPAVIIGTAFKVDEPISGNVRNYTDQYGQSWIGDDTSHVVYFSCETERDAWISEVVIGADYSSETFDRNLDYLISGDGTTLDICDSLAVSRDYSTYCEKSGVMLFEVEED